MGRDSIETGERGLASEPLDTLLYGALSTKHEARSFEAPARTITCVTIARVPAPKEGARIWKGMAFGILHLPSPNCVQPICRRFEYSCPLADNTNCWSVRHMCLTPSASRCKSASSNERWPPSLSTLSTLSTLLTLSRLAYFYAAEEPKLSNSWPWRCLLRRANELLGDQPSFEMSGPL